MQPRASSFILDLLATLKEGSMPVRALVDAGRCFRIGENGLRVALARLLAQGRVERDARGRYRLGPGAEPNLRGGLARAREQLLALGLDPAALVFEARGLEPASEERARGLWEVASLEAAYAGSLEEIERSARRLPGLPEADAMVESFLLGGRVIRQLVLDPLLPDEILPATTRDALVNTMRDYDGLGRRCWARFLDRYGVPHLRTPADTRIAEGAGGLALAAGGA